MVEVEVRTKRGEWTHTLPLFEKGNMSHRFVVRSGHAFTSSLTEPRSSASSKEASLFCRYYTCLSCLVPHPLSSSVIYYGAGGGIVKPTPDSESNDVARGLDNEVVRHQKKQKQQFIPIKFDSILSSPQPSHHAVTKQV